MRIGFCCKFIDHPRQAQGIGARDAVRAYNTRATTVSWLNRQSRDQAVARLWEIMAHNVGVIKQQLERVATWPQELRMMRIGSDILPAYTEANWSWFWQQPDVRAHAQHLFAAVGESARQHNIRLSFHPGQFTVLASDNPEIVERSIEEFEYHADMARWLSFGKTFQDFKINVHISGRAGPEGIKAVLPRLSPEARNCITIENDEMSWGLDASLELADHCALVLDLHHHWVRTGEYIQPTDDRYLRVIDSWRGVRPVIHYSYSRDEHLPVGFKHDCMPDLEQLILAGHKKQKLRAHSDFYPNKIVNQWALSFLETADIMAESKGKNLASFALAEEARQLGIS
jgi:UV DNA damage endonuclease